MPILMKSFASFLLLFLFVGCSSYDVTRSGELGVSLTPDQTIYVAQPLDGSFNGKKHDVSGKKAAVALHRGFARYFDNVILADGIAFRSSALGEARVKNADYVVHADLIHWEERATEWSGKPDRIMVKLELLDVRTGASVDKVTVEAKSTWFTLGGDHPEDLLKKPSRKWAKELIGE